MSEAPEVLEIDAPPRAYFEIPTEDGFDAPPIRIVFKTLALTSKDKERLREQANLHLNLVRSELQDRGGGIIWWRIRPEIESYPRGKWHSYCRLDTSPQLPDWFWAQIVVPEGAKAPEI